MASLYSVANPTNKCPNSLVPNCPLYSATCTLFSTSITWHVEKSFPSPRATSATTI